MSTAFLEPYIDVSSPVHRLDARVKVVVVLTAIGAINLTPQGAWPALAAYAVLAAAVLLLARINARVALKRSLVALPFALMAAASVPFVREGRVLADVPLLGWRLAITDVGLERLAAILARSWLSLLAAATLTVTTPFPELVRALRGLGVPLVLAAVLSLMYRYLFVLVDEAQRLARARDARSGSSAEGHAGGTLRWRARVTGSMLGTLFLRTYERSERIYQAMLARGYDGQVRVLDAPRLTAPQAAAGAAVAAAFGLVLVWAHILW